MRYRLTALSPLLVGDGRRLSAIDYMVWKDQVNVLDQRRIFRLLSKGPRLEGYLTQIRKATKLDFASWGGFAQNFADRRIPFENAAYSRYWERAPAESLNIPTFSAGVSGPYLPGTAIKGALRTGILAAMHDRDALPEAAARYVSVGDSAPVSNSAFKVHLLRVATLTARPGGGYSLGWKQSPRGTVDGRRPEDSTPVFAEMAPPGTVFEGAWVQKRFLDQPEIRRALGWRVPVEQSRILAAVNDYAAKLLAMHRQYVEWTGLEGLGKTVSDLTERLKAARQTLGCLVCLGWGGGFLTKTVPQESPRLQFGLPSPKTRKIVFLGDRPASLPGWAILELM